MMAWFKLWRRRSSCYWKLPLRDRVVLLQALALTRASRAAIPVLGLRRWQGFLDWLYRPNGVGAPSLRDVDCALLVRLASQHGPWRPNCLQQSVALRALMLRQGRSAQLKIGVRRRDGKFEAHAWIERSGRALNDPQDACGGFSAFSEAIPSR